MLYPLLLFSVTPLILYLKFFALLAAASLFLFPRAYEYFFRNVFWTCSLLFRKNFIRFVTLSSPVSWKSSSKIGLGFPLSKVFGVSTGCSNSSPDKEKEGCSCSSLSPARHLQTLDRSGGFGQGVLKEPSSWYQYEARKEPSPPWGLGYVKLSPVYVQRSNVTCKIMILLEGR